MADCVVGEELQGYRIQREIGRGRLGTVFEVVSDQSHGPAALRLIDETHLRGSIHQVRLHKSLQISARLAHPNLCSFRDVGVRKGQLYLVSDLAEGTPLGKVWHDPEWRRIDRILRAGEDLLEACAYLHRSGLIHGSLEPNSIFVGDYGRLLVTEPGLANAIRDSSEGATRATELFPPRYASPEAVANFPEDERSDLFQVAALLYEMAFGRPLFQSERLADMADEIKTPISFPPTDDWPEGMRAFLEKALAIDPNERWSKAHIMLAQLRSIQARLAAGDPLRSQGRLRDYLEAVLENVGSASKLGELRELRGQASIWDLRKGGQQRDGLLCYLPGRLLQSEALSASGLCARIARLKSRRPPHLALPREILIRGQDALVLYPLPEGMTIQETLRSGRRLLLSQILSVYHEVCESLEQLHELDMFYEDFSPDRVLLVFRRGQATPEPQLLFGGVSDLLLHGHLARDNQAIRPVSPYLSPETMRRAQGDVASDVYALGTLLFEALSGLPPPVAGKLHLGPTFSALSPKPPDNVRAGLRELLERTLNPMPSKRFRSAAQVRARLEDTLCQLGEHPSKRGASTLGLFLRSAALFLLLALLSAAALALSWKAPPLEAHGMTATAGLDSVTLRWTTNQPTRAEVAYGPAGQRRSRRRPAASKARSHMVDLDGLQPGKTYTWTVRFPDGRSSKAHVFNTLPMNSTPPQIERSFGTTFVLWSCSPPRPALLEILRGDGAEPLRKEAPEAARHRVSLDDVDLSEGARIRVFVLLPAGGRELVGEVDVPGFRERLGTFLHATRDERLRHLESLAAEVPSTQPESRRGFQNDFETIRSLWAPLSDSLQTFLDGTRPSEERILHLWERLGRLEILRRRCLECKLPFDLAAWPIQGERHGTRVLEASPAMRCSTWTPEGGIVLIPQNAPAPASPQGWRRRIEAKLLWTKEVSSAPVALLVDCDELPPRAWLEASINGRGPFLLEGATEGKTIRLWRRVDPGFLLEGENRVSLVLQRPTRGEVVGPCILRNVELRSGVPPASTERTGSSTAP